MEAHAELVHLVEHEHRVVRAGLAQALHDLARHRADVRASMAADLGFVVDAAQARAHELETERARDALAERGLADAGRADEAQDRAAAVRVQLAHREVLEDAPLDLVEAVVIGVENLARLRDVDVLDVALRGQVTAVRALHVDARARSRVRERLGLRRAAEGTFRAEAGPDLPLFVRQDPVLHVWGRRWRRPLRRDSVPALILRYGRNRMRADAIEGRQEADDRPPQAVLLRERPERHVVTGSGPDLDRAADLRSAPACASPPGSPRLHAAGARSEGFPLSGPSLGVSPAASVSNSSSDAYVWTNASAVFSPTPFTPGSSSEGSPRRIANSA